MAHVKFDVMIPWPLLKKHFEQQQRATDSMLRRATNEESPALRGRAVLLEELLNLPETLQTLAEEDERENANPGKKVFP